MRKLRQIYEILVPINIRQSIERKVPMPAWAIFALIIIIILLGISATKVGKEPILALAKSQPLQVMVGRGTDYRIIEKLNYGAPLLILKEKGEWAYIKTLSGKKGWVEKELLKIIAEPEEKKAEKKYETRYIKMDQLNMRSGPGIGYKIVGKVTKNEAVSKIEVYGGWCKIKTSRGIIGWVNSKYLSISKVK